MKLKLDLWYCLLSAYTAVHIDKSKYIEKSPENLKNPKHAKLIAKIPTKYFANNGIHAKKYT